MMDKREGVYRSTALFLCMESKNNAPSPACSEDKDLSEDLSHLLKMTGILIFEREVPVKRLLSDLRVAIKTRSSVEGNSLFSGGSSEFYYDVLEIVEALLSKLSYYLEEE